MQSGRAGSDPTAAQSVGVLGARVPGAAKDISGAGMDRRVGKSRWRRYGPAAGGAAAVVFAAFALWIARPAGGSVQTVSGDRLEIAAVERGLFEDFIPARGRAEPARTVYLDSVEGGRVESVEVRDGADVEAGDLLVVLSNSQLQLDVLSREAEVAQQLNNMRSLELDLERTQLDHRRNLVELDYQITRLTRVVERRQQLVDRNAASEAELQDAVDELNYFQERRAVTIEARDTDERLMQTQMEQIRESTVRLERNLEVARRNLENLNVRAPVSGVVTALDAEIGQSLMPGQRLGQIDSPNEFKLTVSLDEFYLSRVSLGLEAQAEVGGEPYRSRVSRIFPQVEEGQFTAELLFDEEGAPPALRRGQSLSLRLYLGEAEEALVLPAGAFLAETGGNWAFVLIESGAAAERRAVRTGRRNSRLVEVVDGLEEGDRVVTSSYEPFGDVERLELN